MNRILVTIVAGIIYAIWNSHPDPLGGMIWNASAKDAVYHARELIKEVWK